MTTHRIKWINKNNIEKRVFSDKINEFLKNGWKLGRVKFSKEHCQKTSKTLKGGTFSKKHCQNMSKSKKGNTNRKGKTHSDEAKRKMGEAHIGKSSWNKGIPHSEETKRKIRLSTIKRIEENNGICWPNYNKTACEYFKRFDVTNNTQGRYAVYGGGEFKIEELGYWLDYFNSNLMLIMEWDEENHFDSNGNLREKDIQRQKEIQEFYPDFEFIRLKQGDYSGFLL